MHFYTEPKYRNENLNFEILFFKFENVGLSSALETCAEMVNVCHPLSARAGFWDE